ncbi:hypothetical protein [Deinococcus aerophilus]|nr:hypothetical protein [Deinococcus aerophilus]
MLVPLFFLGSVVAFPLLRRQMIHRHRMELLREQAARDPVDRAALSGPLPEPAAELALRLPEPHRLYALALLCRLQDALAGEHAAPLDVRNRFLVTQARHDYLPATLRAYLDLTPAARARIAARGQSAEALLREQLEQISAGVSDALRLDHTAADRLLTQGHFLQDRFFQERFEQQSAVSGQTPGG